tara:strand:+ start:11088 stop:12899 length:1812 start_codon:yes stop_codon:yes gene_type:complete
MKFSKSLLDEIKSKIEISDIVGKRVALQKRGKEFIGLSPFQNEKTPSFTVNNEKQFYHCFSTNKHGDIFTFLVDVEGMSFPQAVEQLAEYAGVELRALTKKEEQKIINRKKLLSIMEIAGKYFVENLRNDNRPISYLNERGIGKNIIEEYHIGYAKKDFSSLNLYLSNKGFLNEDILRAGLIIESSKKKKTYYDRYRDRIIFPITNSHGKIVGFGGRVLNIEDKPKYMNSPETEIFHKGDILFNFSNIKSTTTKIDNLVIVEGYMDAISLCAFGFKNVVAPLGTAMTEKQLDLAWNLTDSPIICFDGDKAGKKASERVMDLAISKLKPGKNIRFINLDDGLDPDDYVKKYGIKSFEELIKNSTQLNYQIWNNYLINSDITIPEGKADFERKLRDLLKAIKDKNIKKHYGLFFKNSLQKLFYSYNDLNIPINKKNTNAIDKLEIKNSKVGSGQSIPAGLEALLISGVLIFPEIIEINIENLESLIIEHEFLKKIRDKIIDSISLEESFNLENIKRIIEENYSDNLKKELKFSKKYWSNYKNSTIETISSIWVEIFEDDQHIKSLEIEINNFDKNIKDDKNEKRLITILEKKDFELRKITEKYGQ